MSVEVLKEEMPEKIIASRYERSNFQVEIFYNRETATFDANLKWLDIVATKERCTSLSDAWIWANAFIDGAERMRSDISKTCKITPYEPSRGDWGQDKDDGNYIGRND